jgi:hypothetical protein
MLHCVADSPLGHIIMAGRRDGSGGRMLARAALGHLHLEAPTALYLAT